MFYPKNLMDPMPICELGMNFQFGDAKIPSSLIHERPGGATGKKPARTSKGSTLDANLAFTSNPCRLRKTMLFLSSGF